MTMHSPMSNLLSKALKVGSRLVESELLCFSLNKKLQRKDRVASRSDVLEAWTVIPKLSPIFMSPLGILQLKIILNRV